MTHPDHRCITEITKEAILLDLHDFDENGKCKKGCGLKINMQMYKEANGKK